MKVTPELQTGTRSNTRQAQKMDGNGGCYGSMSMIDERCWKRMSYKQGACHCCQVFL